MTPNPAQIKSIVGSIAAMIGGAVATYFAIRGWDNAESITSILASPAFIGIVTSVVVTVWGVFANSPNNIVAVADALPNVQAVIMKPTDAGRATAEAIPSATVVVAGTPIAAELVLAA